MQFDITFKNEKEQTYRLIIFFFVVVHALFFTYLLFGTSWKTGAAGLIIIVLYSGYRLLVTKTSEHKFSYGSGIFSLFFMLFSVMLSWWLLIAEGILSILSGVLLQKRSIYFSPYLIELRARPFKRYKWEDFTNIVLKDNILTLDFKTNKLLQAEIETNTSEEAFNTFAKEHLNNT